MAEYKELGVALRAYRVAANESIEDVSNALELDMETIERIEQGTLQPKPELLELMARHFTLREQEAERLLELAGYKKDEFTFDLDTDIFLDDLAKEVESMIMPVLYTDTVKVVSNKFGVVVNFVQSNGSAGKPVIISRVGMSREHALSVIEVLKRSLEGANKSKPEQSSDAQ